MHDQQNAFISGIHLFYNGNYQGAIDALSVAIADSPDDIHARFARCAAFFAAGRLLDAAKDRDIISTMRSQ